MTPLNRFAVANYRPTKPRVRVDAHGWIAYAEGCFDPLRDAPIEIRFSNGDVEEGWADDGWTDCLMDEDDRITHFRIIQQPQP